VSLSWRLPRTFLFVPLLAMLAFGVTVWERGLDAGTHGGTAAAAVPVSDVTTRTPAPARTAPAKAAHHRLAPAPALPAASPWALPPMITLQARRAGTAHPARLRAAVIASPRLLLSPAARRAVDGGQVASGALLLLLHMPRVNSPLLVFAASGSHVRVQEPALWMTRRALKGLLALPHAQQPSLISFRPMHLGTILRRAPHGGMLGAQAVAIAERYLGIPYRWGGASPRTGFDCSGLMMFVYAKLGIYLDHYAAFQFHEGTPVAVKDLMPGDLVFFEPTVVGPGHVGMYVGNGQFIQAPHTGDVVKLSPLASYAGIYVGAVRPG
jgi:hypothetical protein